MSNEHEQSRRNLTKLRIITAGSVAVLGVAGVAVGKALTESNSKAPSVVAITEEIPGGLTPVETAIRELGVTFTPTIIPPTETPKPVATATATATNTPEVPKDVPCGILADCSQTELVEEQIAPGLTTRMIGSHESAGKPLLMPIDGQIAKTELDDTVIFYKGNRAVIFDPNNPKRRYIITGDIKFIDMLTKNMKKGDIIGYTQDTGIEMLGYNIIFYVADIGADNREVINEAEMKRLDPVAYDKPLKKVVDVSQGPTTGGTIYINTFHDAPPTN